MSKKFLITGGAGFLGSHISTMLIESGNQVLVIDNYATSYPGSLGAHQNLKIIEGDICDRNALESIFIEFKPDVVIHAAASYKDPNDWHSDVKTNVKATAHLARLCQEHDIEKIIYLQTALCYGDVPKEKTPIQPDQSFNPNSSYAMSKVAGEYYLSLSGVPLVTLVIANVYGPRHYSGPMPAFFKRLKNNLDCQIAETRRDFIEIRDFLSLFEKVLNSNHTGRFHVSSDKDYSIEEIFNLMVKTMGIKDLPAVEIKTLDASDVGSLMLDNKKTKRVYSWMPNVDLKDGIVDMVNWFEANPVQESFSHLKKS